VTVGASRARTLVTEPSPPRKAAFTHVIEHDRAVSPIHRKDVMRHFRPLILTAVTAAAVAAVPAAASAGGPYEPRYEARITNLTPTLSATPGSQPFSPPLVAVHRRSVDVVEPGTPAGAGVEGLAEDAINGPLQDALNALRPVDTAFTLAGGPIPSTATRMFTFSAKPGFNRLSVLSMIVNTNDGFWAADSIKLRSGPQTHYLYAYDAGTELNDELAGSIPGPCCDGDRDGTPENGVVTMHPGIAGVGDLDPDDFGWGLAPVAKLEIKRVG
jgi:hypothetical protein